MAKVLNCECGVRVRAESDDELVEGAMDHLRELHPEIAATITPEQVLAMSEEEAED